MSATGAAKRLDHFLDLLAPVLVALKTDRPTHRALMTACQSIARRLERGAL